MTATTEQLAPAEPTAVKAETPFRRFVSDFCDSRTAVVGFFGVMVVVFIALFAPWIAPTDPYDLAR